VEKKLVTIKLSLSGSEIDLSYIKIADCRCLFINNYFVCNLSVELKDMQIESWDLCFRKSLNQLINPHF